MKKRGWLMLLLLVALLPGMRVPTSPYSYYFGIRIYPQSGFLLTTAIVTVQEKKVVRHEIISRDQFVLMMSGVYESKANPFSKNIFQDNGIYTCNAAVDSITARRVNVRCPLFDELWKIRYKVDIRNRNYLFGQSLKKEGWAGTDFFPSKTQYEFLKKEYGADGCNEFIWGDSLIKFMRNVNDSNWVARYKEMK